MVALEFFTVLMVAIMPHVLGSLLILTNKDYLKRFRPWQRMLSAAVHDLGKLLLLAYVVMNQSAGWAAVGLDLGPAELTGTAAIGGIATAYLLLIFVVGRLRSKAVQLQREELRRTAFQAGGFSDFYGQPQRAAYLIVLWLGVVAEDLVLRGYLILGLGARTGAYWPWIVFSLLLSVILHLYQGLNRQVIFTQVFFAAIFIVVSFAAGNVLAAIIPHLIYDTTWILKGWAAEDKPAAT